MCFLHFLIKRIHRYIHSFLINGVKNRKHIIKKNDHSRPRLIGTLDNKAPDNGDPTVIAFLKLAIIKKNLQKIC